MSGNSERRLQGAYEQAQAGRFMVRVKLPGGTLSSDQAEALAQVAERFARATVHLTTRMSIELHDVAEADLEAVWAGVAAAGLTSRGACGGAVRGVAMSTPLAAPAAVARCRALAAAIQQHFTGKRGFEGLPKKFKVGVDASYRGGRHLIQDAGLVYAGAGEGGVAHYDLWLAGGLGRQPTAAFCARRAVPEAGVLPALEAVVEVYQRRAAKGRRLKHLVQELGVGSFLELLGWPEAPTPPAVGAASLPEEAAGAVTVPIFGGELPVAALRALAALARDHAGGRLVLTPGQDVVLLAEEGAGAALAAALARLGRGTGGADPSVPMAICPGSHACKMGLAPTRDLACELLAAMGPRARGGNWAISGCPNSCAQPQLARFGVVCTRSVKQADGSRAPHFDLLRRLDDGLGEPVAQRLTRGQLVEAVRELG